MISVYSGISGIISMYSGKSGIISVYSGKWYAGLIVSSNLVVTVDNVTKRKAKNNDLQNQTSYLFH